MADRGYIPSSPACGQWEMLLADALDGHLKPEDEATFAAHMAACPACTALFEEARRGREWLEFLSPEPEVPAGLLEKILAQTGPGQVAGFGLVTEAGGAAAMPQPSTPARKGRVPGAPLWQRPGFTGHARRYAEPRLLMTAAMAFFSVALTLNLTGVRLNNLHWSELRPGTVRSIMTRRIVTASIPIVRYYDRLVFLYQVESRMRNLPGNGEGENPPQQQPRPAGPGVSRQDPGQNPGGKDGGSRLDPPQRAGGPVSDVSSGYVETSLKLQVRPSVSAIRAIRRWPAAHSVSSVSTVQGAVRQRSTIWTA
ncbi:MAG: anti-sigma factor family protein [Terracidiphilus sp.]